MKLANVLRSQIKGNSPLILTVVAGIGTVATAYLSSRATIKAVKILEEKHDAKLKDIPFRKQDVKHIWRPYVPAAISGATTIASVVGANRLEVKKTIAAQTALAVTQRTLTEYKEQVVKEVGERKATKIKDQVAEEKMKKNPAPKDLVVVGAGNVICCELFTGRHFPIEIEKLHRAVNDLNAQLLKHDYATLNDFYYLIGLKQTTKSGSLGWKTPRLMDLDITPIQDDEGRPCLGFEYNYVDPV